MKNFWQKTRWLWLGLLGIALLGAIVPIPGELELNLKNLSEEAVYPQFQLVQDDGQMRVIARDIEPWTHVLLEYDDLARAEPLAHGNQDTDGAWTWEWVLPISYRGTAEPPNKLNFFHSCDEGCLAWGDVRVSAAETAPKPPTTPTKLGLVLADPARNWHGKQGWSVEIAYADSVAEDYWSVDDLALRVRQHKANGVRVLVRVEYAQGQSLPLPDDYVGLEAYLRYAERLVRDQRLASVHGYIIGSNMNASWANKTAENTPVTPAWYARVFNGYGADAERTDNMVERIRAIDHEVRVIAGPINPWNSDQDGDITHEIDVPWLNYMRSMVAYLDEGAAANMASGVADSAPDGFAVQAFGRTATFDMKEPTVPQTQPDWNGAQAGFRVYEDWLAIINHYPHTQGKPVYVNATNTSAAGFPVDNYPAGWLTTALDVVNAEPQIVAFCWFMDYFPHDTRWENYSLSAAKGLLSDAAAEFDALLQR